MSKSSVKDPLPKTALPFQLNILLQCLPIKDALSKTFHPFQGPHGPPSEGEVRSIYTAGESDAPQSRLCGGPVAPASPGRVDVWVTTRAASSPTIVVSLIVVPLIYSAGEAPMSPVAKYIYSGLTPQTTRAASSPMRRPLSVPLRRGM